MNISKRRTLMNAFFKSQFSYRPLVWMCHSPANNGIINRLHERCLRLIYSDKQSSFQTLMEKYGSASVQNQNLEILATEMYKIKNELSHWIVTELFKTRNEQRYNLRNNSQFTIPPIRTVHHESKSISFLKPKISNNANSIEAFKMQIKKWKPEKCAFQLCKLYVQKKCQFCWREFL